MRIHIIESPHADDLFSGRHEGEALTSALRLADAEVSYHLATNAQTFERALALVSDSYLNSPSKTSRFPFVHISAHGNNKGVFLTDEQLFEWVDFADALQDINDKIGGIYTDKASQTGPINRVSLCFSSCEGFSAVQIHNEDECPFAFLVGPMTKIPWSDSLTAYQVFYHGLLQDENSNIPDLVKRMNAAICFENAFQWTMSPAIHALKDQR